MLIHLPTDLKKSTLRTETPVQYSGTIDLSQIELLKEKNYYVVDVVLDGDAPKQYIKAYFYYTNCPRIRNPKTWDGYYAKFGGKSYPHESIVEYCINKLGESLGLKMNETRLVVAGGQIRFLSKDFVGPGKRLIHGIEILAEYFEDKQFVDDINKDRKARREFLTFDVVEEAIKHVYPSIYQSLLNSLVDLIAFDALIGNNDRHFYNWGVLGDIEKRLGQQVFFAPIYDSARGLFWNSKDDKIITMHKEMKGGQKVIEKYAKASLPRFSFNDNPSCDHFELIKFLVQNSKSYKERVEAMLTPEKEESVLSCLHEVTGNLFLTERIELMRVLLCYRFEKMREAVI